MTGMGHVARPPSGRYSSGTHPHEVPTVYPQVLIPIFMLFVAALAYGWFYWQHAKARGTKAGQSDTDR